MPKLHFLSACTGFVIAGLLALTTSQASPPPTTLNPASLRIEYMPHPRDMVQIKEGTPYVVPPGKIFVLTALGTSGGGKRLLRVNGVDEVLAGWHDTANYGGVAVMTSVAPVPSGFSVNAGSTIEVSLGSPDGFGRAWGYLASQ